MKHRYIFALLSAILGVAVYFGYKAVTNPLNTVNEQEIRHYTIVTEKNDVFRIVVMQRMMDVDADIYFCSGKIQKFLTRVEHEEGRSQKLQLTLLDDSPDYRSYDVLGQLALIIEKKSNTCDDLPYMYLDELTLRNHGPILTYFYHVAQQKVATKDWRWFDNFAGFLVLNHDKSTIRMVRRYAKGNFTKEELAINKDNLNDSVTAEYYKDKVIDRAAALVGEYHL